MNYSQIEQNLQKWFSQNSESHFFRKDRTPYKTWISEIALQQTRMQAALPKLRCFLEIFPDIESLANSTEQEILEAFQGLGYYNRARNLRKGAKHIVQDLNGIWPQKKKELIKIPSIGDYTASIIASIHFNQNEPSIDGNAKRVMSRMFQLKGDIFSKDFLNALQSVLTKIFKNTKLPGKLNESIMELGQKLCTKSKPQCEICPLKSQCLSYHNAETHLYPTVKKKAPPIHVIWHCFVLYQGDAVLLEKADDFYFLKGHFIFPGVIELPAQKIFSSDHAKRLTMPPMPNITLKHTITKHKIEMNCYFIESSQSSNMVSLMVNLKEAKKKLASSAMLKVLNSFEKNLHLAQTLAHEP